MSTSTSAAANQTIEDLKALVRDAEATLASAGEGAEERVAELRDRLRAALDHTQTTYRRAVASAKERLGDADVYVRSHPYQSVGVAVALGAILGLLIGRRLP